MNSLFLRQGMECKNIYTDIWKKRLGLKYKVANDTKEEELGI